MPFEYAWAVQDDYSGNDFGHNTNSDGKTTTGEYRVLLPDGRTQVVRYTADHVNGFQAEVSYEGEARPYEPQPSASYNQPRQERPSQTYQQPRQERPRQTYEEPQTEAPRQNYQPPRQERPSQLYEQPRQERPSQTYEQPRRQNNYF